jgi:hypothetical protein
VSRSLALLIALLPLVFAPVFAPSQLQGMAVPGYTVRGTVINSVTGQPVARALVSLWQDRAMLTDSSGAFSFDNVSLGSYALSVTKPGFLGHGGLSGGFHGPVALRTEPGVRIQVGPDMPALTVPITPLSAITGRVTLSTADPADGIRVQAFTRLLQDGRPRWSIAGEARTRSDGSFRIANLEAGNYRLSTVASIDRPAQALSGHSAVWGYPSVYYPGTTEIGGAGLLHLGPGQQAEADITLIRQQFFPVVGLVHDPSEGMAGFQVLDSAGRDTGVFVNYNRREGILHAAVPNGAWTIQAHSFGQEMQFGSTTFQVNGAPVSLAISLQPVPRIPVVVRRDFSGTTGPPPPSTGPGFNLELESADEMGPAGNAGMVPSEASAPGQWELRVNQPGRYWIKAQAWPPAYVSSISSGGTDLGSSPLTVLPGSPPASIEVTLRDDSGKISGIVDPESPGAPNPVASGPSPQVWIYAIPLFSTAAPLQNTMPNSDGRFTFYTLPPGSYRVVACDAPQEIDFHSPDVLGAWAGKGEVISVDASGTASVELHVLHINAEDAQ